MTYVIAIPSYKRSQLLYDKTLTMLKNGDVKSNLIYIFVANEQEQEIYKKVIPKKLYNKIIIGVHGINEQRKFIIKYFPNGKYIVSLDDDVEQILSLNNHKKLIKLEHVHEFFINAFKELKNNKLFLWGVYPTPNEFYLKDQKPITTNLKFIIACVYGFINRHNMISKSDIKEKEDVLNSILYYIKDNGIIRFNHIAFKTKFKNTDGGLGAIENRFTSNKEAALYIHKNYPEYTRIKIRKNGMYEIILRDKSKLISKKN